MTTTTATREDLEARCRRAMARIPAARGWDSQRDRAEQLAVIDRMLDRWNAGGS